MNTLQYKYLDLGEKSEDNRSIGIDTETLEAINSVDADKLREELYSHMRQWAERQHNIYMAGLVSELAFMIYKLFIEHEHVNIGTLYISAALMYFMCYILGTHNTNNVCKVIQKIERKCIDAIGIISRSVYKDKRVETIKLNKIKSIVQVLDEISIIRKETPRKNAGIYRKHGG